jgi:hypothetical protein
MVSVMVQYGALMEWQWQCKKESQCPFVHHTWTEPRTNCLSHGMAMIRGTICVCSTYISSSLMVFSKSNLYWNPEQPPPSTITRKQLPSVAISFKRCMQLSLIWSASDVELNSVCGAADVTREYSLETFDKLVDDLIMDETSPDVRH